MNKNKLGMLVLAAVAALTLSTIVVATAHAAPPASTEAAEESGVVNLNSATEEELMLLPGVGPSKATRIVEWRKKHGKFKKVEDLTKVKGFGYKTFKKLKPHLAVSGATTYKGKKKGGTTRAELKDGAGQETP